ncbi:hypothetical protein PVL29_011773 [Vitis rotundifolia]|uniref:Uncharacterized protein n=1 Tax=Vitis rotundifolia TaxID=103349 RepID=A0AA38ZPY6_VITRO|nr:hypothetical protein PVL29_011773 [Vitis rotundifolia]
MATQLHPPEDASHDFYAYYRFKLSRDSPNDARNTLLVVGALVAAVSKQESILQAEFGKTNPLWMESLHIQGRRSWVPTRLHTVLTAIYSMSLTYYFSIAAVEPPGAVKSGYILIAFLLPYVVRLSRHILKTYKESG